MTDQVRTLVVDDEDGIRFFLEETLRLAGHEVDGVSSGQEALERLREIAYDLVMLDLKLGDRIDGIRVLEAVKWRWPATMVVILTAHGSLESAMAAIREGVDGYLLKPVEPDEVRQVVRETLNRRRRLAESQSIGEEANLLRRGPFAVDLEKHTAALHGQLLDLTPREFKLLAYLIENADRVVSPPELVRVVNQYKCESLHEAREIIKWYVHHLRAKVEPDLASPRYILNVRGVGYTFGE